MRRLILLILAIAALAAPGAVLAATGLTGSWRAVVTSKRHRTTWILDFRSNGRLAADRNGRSVGSSSFSVHGTTVTIGTGPGCASKGYYHFKVTGNKLRFTRIKDTCKTRRALFGYTYTRLG